MLAKPTRPSETLRRPKGPTKLRSVSTRDYKTAARTADICRITEPSDPVASGSRRSAWRESSAHLRAGKPRATTTHPTWKTSRGVRASSGPAPYVARVPIGRSHGLNPVIAGPSGSTTHACARVGAPNPGRRHAWRRFRARTWTRSPMACLSPWTEVQSLQPSDQ